MPSQFHILLSDEAARAVCWTLVHSLWQGTLAALIAGAIILTTRKRSATLRYALLSTLVTTFILGVSITFSLQLNSTTPGTPPINIPTFTQVVTTHQPHIQNLPVTPTTPAAISISTWQQTINYLNSHATLITLIWLACLGLQLLRLAGGLYNIHRLRRDSTPATEYWAAELAVLARRLRIRRPVALLQSAAVKAPAAFGFLKPAILVPLGFLAQLPAHQVETILLHELAHIHRNDYFANILLHLTEAIFFFNPGIRWIATLIRREREACCDDMVLAGTSDRNNYFEALVAFTQLTIDNQDIAKNAYALQLGGKRKNDLFWRIRRMLENENKRLHLLEKTILSVALFALVSFSIIKPRPAVSGDARRTITAQSCPISQPFRQ
jgi:bla regulator protein BlaR1